ncbi:MAG TPA: aminoacetone oxidase family FAD-binding enzyme, partial [Armatimonadetes bacterium]|nr:aminoacetone oxidase family FAD-binding enzyme [Armatimonadota bacterium]
MVTPVPSLSALEIREAWVGRLSGLSLKNVSAKLYSGQKKVAEEFGEMLFT